MSALAEAAVPTPTSKPMSPSRKSANSTYVAANTHIMAMFRPSAIHDARTARSTRPRPRFWPTRVAAAAPHPKPLNSAKLSSLSPMPNAACALVTASATCGRAFGAATSTNRSV